AEGGAARHTQGVGLGERIAKEGLEAQARRRERASGEQGEEDARQAQLPEDRERRRVAAQHVGQTDRLAAEQGSAERHGEPEQAEEREGGAGAERAHEVRESEK